MNEWWIVGLAGLGLLNLIGLAWLLRLVLRRPDPAAAVEPLREALQVQADAQRERAERLAREQRSEFADSARATRQELTGALTLFQQTLLTQSGDVARTQNEQIDSFRTQLATMQQQVSQSLQQAAAQLVQQGQAAREAQDAALRRQADSTAEALQRFGTQSSEALQRLGATLAEQLKALGDANERRLAEVRETVEGRLTLLQQGNEAKLEQMRATVDEKLHATLEQRLGESFKQVAERLEQVHKGLGEMQTLARDVGSLNRVLTNVKTRGIYGEVQLAGLLEQVFTPEQYAANVETVPGSGARVEFAIRLPGRHGQDGGPPLWLPIDAKFPREDYERLLDAQERADAPAVEAAGRAIEARLRLEARSIREKYVAAPHTTDFAILFVPTESLYAEALRRPGLMEALQREHKITLAGPTTLLATLTSLQMGFRTLALERRSAEVWEVLGAVKTEFGKFGDVLARTKKKLDEASNTIDQAATRTRAMARQLRTVESLPEHRVQQLLPGLLADDADEAAAEADAAVPRGRPLMGPSRDPPSTGAAPPLGTTRLLALLIVGQIALHAAMAGQRLATPLQALQVGRSAWAVGVLLALFAALPVLIAMPEGRMADRHGYHRPQRVAVMLTLVGVGSALLACWLTGWPQFTAQCLGAAASGAGTNVGVIVVLRTAGQLANDSTERLRIFSWLGMAFSMANVVGPVAAGFMVDAGGFAAAYALLLAMPLVALAVMRQVPAQPRAPAAPRRPPGTSRWNLLATPGLKRLLFINWLLSASWDVHSFSVPVLGHARGYSASTIGLVLGLFTAAITVVRFIVPLFAHRLQEVTVLRTAMLMTAAVFMLYPFAATPWLMAGCAMLLGLSLGAVQPTVMSALHHLTPPDRHGEAIAFRSMTINLSSSVMPLAFGVAGTALGPGAVFWLMGAAVGGGSWAVKGLTRVFGETGHAA